jgi:hypothetical protein
VLQGFLFGVTARDPVILGPVTLAVALATLAACTFRCAAPSGSTRWWRCGRNEATGAIMPALEDS